MPSGAGCRVALADTKRSGTRQPSPLRALTNAAPIIVCTRIVSIQLFATTARCPIASLGPAHKPPSRQLQRLKLGTPIPAALRNFVSAFPSEPSAPQ
jgi:hypothetical protein